MLEGRPPPVPGLPQLLRPPSLLAALNTPEDWIRCTCWLLPCPYSLPRLIGGSASTTLLSRPARAHSRYGLQSCSPTMCGLTHEASSQPVSEPQCSLTTRPNQRLSGRVLPPLVICAVGAHYEIGSTFLVEIDSQMRRNRAVRLTRKLLTKGNFPITLEKLGCSRINSPSRHH